MDASILPTGRALCHGCCPVPWNPTLLGLVGCLGTSFWFSLSGSGLAVGSGIPVLDCGLSISLSAFSLAFSCWRLVQGPTTRGWLEPGAAWGALLGHSDGSVSSSAFPGSPIHSKESHTFPLDIRIEPNCAPGQSPAYSAGPSRPGKGSQMVLA